MALKRPPLVQVFAANVRRVMEHYGENPTSAGVRCKVSQQQFRRFVRGEHSVTLDSVAAVAKGYGLEPYQLLIPGLDPANPQVLRLLSASELKLYAALKEAMSN